MAAYTDLLRGGSHIGSWNWSEVARVASQARGEDRFGLRNEFVRLVEQARQLREPGASGTAAAGD